MPHIDNNDVFTPAYRIEVITNAHTETMGWVKFFRSEEKPSNESLRAWVDLYNDSHGWGGSHFHRTEMHRASGKISNDESVYVTNAFVIHQATGNIVAIYNVEDEPTHDLECAICGNVATHYVADVVVVTFVPLDKEGERDYTNVIEEWTEEEQNGANLCQSCVNYRKSLI